MSEADRPPSLSELAALACSEDVNDRAFANGALRLSSARFPSEVRVAYTQARAASLHLHAPTREAVRSGSLRGAALRRLVDGLHDYQVEELLDVAFPPLDETPLPPHHTPYVPSGLREILHALDLTGLGPSDTFVDLGAGLGKVVMLANLLTGARAHGVELDATLVTHARASVATLGLDGVSFTQGDARDADLGSGSIFYLYSPFSGPVLDAVLQRLEAIAWRRALFVCASPVDTTRFPWLEPLHAPGSWLVVHRSITSARLR